MRARLAGRDNGGGLILHSGLFLCMHVIWFRDRCLAVSTLRPKKLSSFEWRAKDFTVRTPTCLFAELYKLPLS